MEVVTLCNGTSGNRVDADMIVSKYWFPLFDQGNGPTQSTITCSNGPPKVLNVEELVGEPGLVFPSAGKRDKSGSVTQHQLSTQVKRRVLGDDNRSETLT